MDGCVVTIGRAGERVDRRVLRRRAHRVLLICQAHWPGDYAAVGHVRLVLGGQSGLGESSVAWEIRGQLLWQRSEARLC